MFRAHVLLVAISVLSLTVVPARAAEKEKEPPAIIELGGAGEWSLTGGGSSFGPSAAIEFEPIKDWLEIEIGTAPLFDHGHAEWSTDVLFKKPFTLSDKLEFMIGAGPQWSQPTNGVGKLGVWISCSGQPRIENSDASLSRPTFIRLAANTNSRLA